MWTREEATARVQRGAEDLDRLRPGWFREIDVCALRLSECATCVVGQLFGPYAPGVFTHGLIELGWRDDSDAYGVSGNADERNFPLLQDAWIEAIAARLHPDDARSATTTGDQPESAQKSAAVPVPEETAVAVPAR